VKLLPKPIMLWDHYWKSFPISESAGPKRDKKQTFQDKIGTFWEIVSENHPAARSTWTDILQMRVARQAASPPAS
jgi:hypothetical protein